MTFKGYMRNIEAKTGLTPTDFRIRAEAKGFTKDGQLRSEVKATEVVKWLKGDFALGHGHAMAIYALLKGVKTEHDD